MKMKRKKPNSSPHGAGANVIIASRKLTRDQKTILTALPIDTDFNFVTFAWLAEATDMPPRRARVVTRQLARKGLTEYQCGLFNMDGQVCGSGYALTDLGRVVAQVVAED